MLEDVGNMRANSSHIEDEVVCPLFLRTLPDEYNVFRQMLEREGEKLTIDRLHPELRTTDNLLKEGNIVENVWHGLPFFWNEAGIDGRRREKCGNVSGIKKKGGGALRSDSNC